MRVVVDANLLIADALPVDYSAEAHRRLAGWLEEGAQLFAPSLWLYEAVSAIRKSAVADRLGGITAYDALDALLAFPITTVAPDADLLAGALAWADRLGDLVAYDATYLALADSLGAPLWTADGPLYRRARAAGAEFVWLLIREHPLFAHAPKRGRASTARESGMAPESF
ncbi:MAG TPA: type II toxin-antitoxin system VapC family toxin [Thermoanaerobaculia bacterium]|nr:type II toxin-antitoxin system VapC family toxin [Thermoanaerobaculia bacterium]